MCEPEAVFVPPHSNLLARENVGGCGKAQARGSAVPIIWIPTEPALADQQVACGSDLLDIQPCDLRPFPQGKPELDPTHAGRDHERALKRSPSPSTAVDEPG
jgi:hypothetical protein